MEIESGDFICPECGENGMSNYLKWQNKQNRWIFYKKDKGWEYKCNSYTDHDDNTFFKLEHTEDAEKCWEIYSGELARHYIFPKWIGQVWQCNHCDFKSPNFQDFIKK